MQRLAEIFQLSAAFYGSIEYHFPFSTNLLCIPENRNNVLRDASLCFPAGILFFFLF